MKVLLAVVLGIVFLWIFYRAVRLQWPASYFGATDLLSYSIAASPFRYVLFRFAPVFITCLFVAVSLDRANESAITGALLVGLGHASTTTGLAFIRWLRSARDVRRRRLVLAIVHGFTFVGVLATAYLAWLLRPFVAPVVPPVSQLTATLWTALLAGVVGAFIVRFSEGSQTDEYELVSRSVQSIPKPLWDLAEDAATTAGGDPSLLRAVMIVENLQRPAWVRRVERVKGKISRAGTYGIMQVRAPEPISDEESVRRASKRLSGVKLLNSEGIIDEEALKAFVQSYNPDQNFAALLAAAYEGQADSQEATA